MGAALSDQDWSRCCTVVQADWHERTVGRGGFDSLKEELVPARDNVIIFDWDDTLLCSTEIKESAIDINNPCSKDIRKLEAAVIRVLQTAMELGRVAIVTNANLSWVQATASIFLPAVLPILERIEVISARQTYESRWPGDALAWKVEAFLDVVGRGHECHSNFSALDRCNSTESCTSAGSQASVATSAAASVLELCGAIGCVNLVVIGDSMAEIRAGEAALDVVQQRGSIVKTLKMIELPTTAQLVGQLRVVNRELPGITSENVCRTRQLVQGFGSDWAIRDTGLAALRALLQQ